MSPADITTNTAAVLAVLVAFALGWVAGAAYVRRLRRQLAESRAESAELADQLTEAEDALGRATGGMTDLLDAVLIPTHKRRGGGDRG